MERALRGKEVMMGGHREPPKRCPRCESTNTKFCYYNNYSQSQPRHFCKACRRYWTEGGTLRNVPQGGGSHRRGSKRPRKTPGATTSRPVLLTGTEVVPPMPPPPPPFLVVGGGGDQGVFPPFHTAGCAGMMPDFVGFPAGCDQGPFGPGMLPGFLNLPIYPPMPPPFDPNLLIHQQPRVAVSSHQQMNITVFTSTTTGPTGPAVSSADPGNGEGYWDEYNNGGEGGGPRPPTPSTSI